MDEELYLVWDGEGDHCTLGKLLGLGTYCGGDPTDANVIVCIQDVSGVKHKEILGGAWHQWCTM